MPAAPQPPSSEPTFYVFDGSNLFHAGRFTSRDELVDALASFVALRGARGVVVFDGAGAETSIGPLDVRYHPHADDLIERLAAERRDREPVAVVSSDRTIATATGQLVRHHDSAAFAGLLRERTPPGPAPRHELEARLDDETRARLERLRRNRS